MAPLTLIMQFTQSCSVLLCCTGLLFGYNVQQKVLYYLLHAGIQLPARWTSLHAVQGIPLFWYWHCISSGHEIGLCVTFQLRIDIMHLNVNQHSTEAGLWAG